MFKKIFEYAGPYKENMYVATVTSLDKGTQPFVVCDG